jgi:hypothetical protein
VIDLPCDDAAAVKAMLQFMYTFDYEIPDESNENCEEEVHDKAVLLEPYDTERRTSTSESMERQEDDRAEVIVTIEDDPSIWQNGTAEVEDSTDDIKSLVLPEAKATSEISPMLFHIKVWALADRVQSRPLRALAEQKFAVFARDEWKSADFPDAIAAVYEVAPPGPNGDTIRKIVVRLAVEHARDLFSLDRGFSNMVQDTPDFGKDFAKALSGAGVGGPPESHVDLEEFKCPTCGFMFRAMLTVQASLACPSCTQENSTRKFRHGGIEKDKMRKKNRFTLSSTGWEL